MRHRKVYPPRQNAAGLAFLLRFACPIAERVDCMYFWVHIVVAVVLTVYFLYRFIKDRLIYQLLFVIWVPATLLAYVPVIASNDTYRTVLGVFQVVMFILVIFFMFRRDPKKTKAAREAMFREMTDQPADTAAPDAGQGSPSEKEPSVK